MCCLGQTVYWSVTWGCVGIGLGSACLTVETAAAGKSFARFSSCSSSGSAGFNFGMTGGSTLTPRWGVWVGVLSSSCSKEELRLGLTEPEIEMTLNFHQKFQNK